MCEVHKPWKHLSLAGKRFLILDDDETLTRTFARILQSAGGGCMLATNTFVGEEILQCSSFDLLVSDVDMPGRTGIELLSILRKAGNQTPCLLVSGKWDEVRLAQAEQLGASTLAKPFLPEQLLDAVRTVFWDATR